MAIEQLDVIRYMTDFDKKRRIEIHESIEDWMSQREKKLFRIVKQLISLMPLSDDELTKMMPASDDVFKKIMTAPDDEIKKTEGGRKLLKLAKQWSSLTNLEIEVAENDGRELVNLVSELANAKTFNDAFSMWGNKQKTFWRQLNTELSPDGRKISNLKLQKQPNLFRFNIKYLSRSLKETAICDMLNKIRVKNNEERLYATLILKKSIIQGIKVSELNDHYIDIVWILIYKKTSEERIKNMVDEFSMNKNVIKNSKINKFKDTLLSTINLYAEKFLVLQKLNSMTFDPIMKKSAGDRRLICDIKKYIKSLSQADDILETVATGLMVPMA